MAHATRRLLALASVLALGACAGNGDGLDVNGRPLDEGSGGGPLTADFASIQDHVFTPICTACHAGAGAPQGLRLDAANSYDLLVGAASNEVPSLQRVKPGDPDHSYLIQKLEGSAAVGARMPFGGPYLDRATIDVIRQWITDGAQRPVAAAAPAQFKIAALAPAPGDALDVPPANIVVALTREIDRATVAADAFQLLLLDASGPKAQPIDVQVSDANPAMLQITPRLPLAPGQYELRVDSGTIGDYSGQRLGDVAAGPASITHFTVGAPR